MAGELKDQREPWETDQSAGSQWDLATWVSWEGQILQVAQKGSGHSPAGLE
jgi:hypothetical protein